MIENKGYLNPLTFSIYIIIFKFWPALVLGPKKKKKIQRKVYNKKIPQYIKNNPKTIVITSKMETNMPIFFFYS